MRSIMLALFTLSLAANTAHAAPTQKWKSDLPERLPSSELGDKAYRMPSGRRVKVSSDWQQIGVAGPNYTIHNNVEFFKNAHDGELTLRTVDRGEGAPTQQRVELPQKNGLFWGQEILRSDNSTSTVRRVFYWHDDVLREAIIPSGASQVEDRPVQIDEAKIAQQYDARQKRRADAAKAFGGKVE